MNRLVIILALLLALCVGAAHRYREQARTAKDNERALLEQVDEYKTKHGLIASSVERLQLTRAQLETYNTQLAEEIKAMRIKLSRVQSASMAGVKTKYVVQTVVKDSIVYVEGRPPDTVQSIRYDDNYLTLHGVIDEGRFSGDIESRDTLIQVVHRVPRKFLFFKFGTKALRQDIVSRNPHSRITFNQLIEIQ